MRRLEVVVVVVTSLAVGFGAAACKKPGAQQQKASSDVPVIKLAAEDVVVVGQGELQTGPRISGTLQAATRAVVRAESGGSVVQIGPELGQTVKKGDLLARIEAKAMGDATQSARGGVEAAQAQYDLAQREVQRTEALVKGGAVAQRELDRARSQLAAAAAAVKQARAQLSSSQSQLGDATVRAPIAGVVARRSVGAGDVVAPGAELYEVIDPSTMRLDASVASDDLAAIAPGKAVDFSVRGYPGQMFAGTIARVAPAADPVTRQIQVLIDIPNPGGKLVAGLYAEGRVSVEKRQALLAPLAAIDLNGDQPTVLRVKGDLVERAVIALGVRDDRAEVAEVTNGLAAGDVLLLARATKNVGPGAKVVVAPMQAAAGSAAPGGSATPAGSAVPTAGSADAGSATAKPVEATGSASVPAGSATPPAGSATTQPGTK